MSKEIQNRQGRSQNLRRDQNKTNLQSPKRDIKYYRFPKTIG